MRSFQRMQEELGLREEDYGFYLGSAQVRGASATRLLALAFESAAMYLTGITNIRDVPPFPCNCRTTGDLRSDTRRI